MSARDTWLTATFSSQPFWWDDAPPVASDNVPLPPRIDTLVIGGGVCGLACAIELARAGCDVTVIDREAIGWGASSRNGGAISAGVNLGRGRSRADLERQLGTSRLALLVDEAKASYDDFALFLEREGVACDLRTTGRFIAAHSAKALDELARRADLLNNGGADEAELLPRHRVSEEVASPRYHGGLVVRRAAALHPALMTQGLAAAARRHGAHVRGQTEALRIVRHAKAAGAPRFTVETTRGPIEANHVVIATNGYTGGLTPWHQRRLVRVASAMIATEQLGRDRVQTILPRQRVYGDTKRLTSYYRPSPDGTRILFGGRARFLGQSAERNARELHATMTALLPGLDGVKISHAWSGHLAFSFDYLPHLGSHDGLHHALACNGSGLVILTHLGRKLAAELAGTANRPSAFKDLAFPTRPLYTGHAWFMPAIATWYRLRDALER